jgi:hypothetical protein
VSGMVNEFQAFARAIGEAWHYKQKIYSS